MKTLKLLALLLALLPTQSLAGGKLSENELKYLIKTCFASFYHPAGQPYQVDRKKFRAMGFAITKDDEGRFEAQRILSEMSQSFKKVRIGPLIEIDRNKRKPNVLLYKDCKISGDNSHMSMPQITNLSSKKVQAMLQAEAKRQGFKPVHNRKREVVWIKGDVAVFLDVSFSLKRGQSAEGKQPPTAIYVDGVHPKDLRGISK